ncbi:MAG: PG0541 family transporter-associated protein [Candidatus Omnitrophota bacterium]
MKMAMIIYNEALDEEVTEVLRACCSVQNYTKIPGVFGRGSLSGIHLGTDIWPGRNNILYVACEEMEGKKIITAVKQLRKSLGAEGIKVFLMPIEELT